VNKKNSKPGHEDKENILERQFESVFNREDTTLVPEMSDLDYPKMPCIQVTSKGVEI
jgi:hypothetical protein